MSLAPPDSPTARADLIVERLPGEILVHDQQRDEAHCLNPLASAVFELCDSQRSPAQIATLARERLGRDVDEAATYEAIVHLGACHLLDGEPAEVSGLSRRQMIRHGRCQILV